MTTISQGGVRFDIRVAQNSGIINEAPHLNKEDNFTSTTQNDTVSLSESALSTSTQESRHKLTVQLSSKDEENIASWAEKAGVSVSAIKNVLHELRDIKFINERKDFLDAASKAGDQLETLVDTTMKLSGDARKEFLAFSGQLSEDDLQNFLATLKSSPEELSAILDLASGLDEVDLSNYLFAAGNSGKGVNIFNKQIMGINSQPDNNLNAYLSAASKSGSRIMAFVESTTRASAETQSKIVGFINSNVNGENLNNFLTAIQGAGDEAVSRIVDTASSLEGEDKANFLVAAARAKNDLNDFVNFIEPYTQKTKGLLDGELSDILSIGSKAEGRLGALIATADKLDLKFVSELSVADTVNFLDAAKKSPDQIAKLTELTKKLSDTDRSNMLFTAAKTNIDTREFLTEVDKLPDEGKSQFILAQANKERETVDREVFMQAILTDSEYQNFKKAAVSMDETKRGELVAVTEEFFGVERETFLSMAGETTDTTGELVGLIQNGGISTKEKSDFLAVGKGLYGESLENYVNAASKTAIKKSGPDEFSDFVNTTKQLHGVERGYFLSAAADVGTDDLGKLTDLVNSLDPLARHSFLRVASDAGHYLEGLINMAENVSPLGTKQFVEIFDSAATTGDHLGTFIEAYV